MKLTKLIQLLAMLAGFAGGYYAVRALFKSEPAELTRLSASVEFGEPLYRQYSTGDYAGAKGAMLALVRHLDEYEAESARRGGAAGGNIDAAMAYVRLAKLEDRQGQGAARDEYMREAVARCERLRSAGRHRSGCEPSYLRAEVDRTDAMLPR